MIAPAPALARILTAIYPEGLKVDQYEPALRALFAISDAVGASPAPASRARVKREWGQEPSKFRTTDDRGRLEMFAAFAGDGEVSATRLSNAVKCGSDFVKAWLQEQSAAGTLKVRDFMGGRFYSLPPETRRQAEDA